LKTLALAVLLAVTATYAQAPNFTPSDQQAMDLKIANLDAQKAQAVWLQKAFTLPEYQSYQQAQKQVKVEAEKIKTAKKWPATVEYNDASGTFFDSAPAKK